MNSMRIFIKFVTILQPFSQSSFKILSSPPQKSPCIVCNQYPVTFSPPPATTDPLSISIVFPLLEILYQFESSVSFMAGFFHLA